MSPNLSEPNVSVNNNPQIILGIEVSISDTKLLSACEKKKLFNYFHHLGLIRVRCVSYYFIEII